MLVLRREGGRDISNLHVRRSSFVRIEASGGVCGPYTSPVPLCPTCVGLQRSTRSVPRRLRHLGRARARGPTQGWVRRDTYAVAVLLVRGLRVQA